MKPFFSNLIDLKIIICASAACMGVTTCMLSAIKVNWSVSVILFSGTYLIYNLPGFIESFTISHKPPKYFKVVYLLFAAAAAFAFLLLPLIAQLVLMLLGTVSIIYYLPVNEWTIKFSLRKIPYIKIFLICFVWAAATASLPILVAQPGALHERRLILVTLERFLFIFAVAIPFDINDCKKDTAFHLITLPVKVGIVNAKIMAMVALATATLLAYINSTLYLAFIIQLFINLFLCFAIILVKQNSSRYIFVLCIDSIMIMQLLLMLIGSFFVYSGIY